jgi:membrane-associated protein
METISTVIDLVIHLDRHRAQLAADFGPWIYAVLFLIVFCETGLVITPFLPGDSLLFAVGALTAVAAGLDLTTVLALLTVAAILGDTANDRIGAKVGPAVFHKRESRWLNPRHLERTHEFYEKYGGKTIILARFIPIIRTFAPFVAGIGRMSYPRFLAYNVIGGVAWVALFVLVGRYFGNIPIVKRNFTLVILAIIVLFILPPVIEVLRHRLGARRSVPDT